MKTADGHGIKAGEAYDPVWAMSELTAEGVITALVEAGYYLAEALIEAYSEALRARILHPYIA